MGNIVTNKKSGVALYNVKSVAEINHIIIPHFEKYPLLTQKFADFSLFKQIVELVLQKEHLTLLGLKKILKLNALPY